MRLPFFPATPISYAVEITFACNNFCSGCANVWEPRRNLIMRHWRAIFDRIAPPENRKKYAELIRITGGEPTLHKEFRQIVEYVDTFGIAHALFTDGRWIRPDETLDVYRNCRNFIGMLVSLHGSEKNAHNAFVESVDTAFAEACESIRRAAEAGLDVFTNTVLTKHSCDQIEAIVALSKDLGASHAVFNRFLGGGHPLEPTEEQLRQAILLIEDLQAQGKDCHIGNCVPQCFVDNTSEGANAGIEHCAISPTGLVRPDNLTSYIFGNILEQSIEDIWQGEKAQWYRQQVPAACYECVELSRCRGGNKSVSIEHGFTQDRLMKEPIRAAEEEIIEFNPDLIPIPNFTIREESFGYLLARYNWSVPVSFAAKPILAAINGQNTLQAIQAQYGDDALNFIGRLFREGCLDFEQAGDDVLANIS